MNRVTGHVTQHAGKCTICCELIRVRECVAIDRKLGTFAHLACELREQADVLARVKRALMTVEPGRVQSEADCSAEACDRVGLARYADALRTLARAVTQ